jgi:hypothetical protein
MLRRLGMLALIGLLSAGCAGVAVKRVATDADYSGGVRFYRPQPYLLITNYASGERQAQIVYLPKVNEEYSLRVRSGFGSVDAKATLADGWNLTSIGESRTPETAELLSALGGVGKIAATTFQGAVGTKGEGLPPGLYAIEFDRATGLVSHLRRVELAEEVPQ